MSAVGRSWCLLAWVGSASAASKSTCSAAGTVLAPLRSATQTLDKLEADLTLVPDCHVHVGRVAVPVDCKVDDGATVQFWFTCNPADDSKAGCQDKWWFKKHAIVRVKDHTGIAASSFGPPLVSTKMKNWDNKTYPKWETNLRSGFPVKRTGTGFNFADVEITWTGQRPGQRPAPGDRIHLHTSIDHMIPDKGDCVGNVDGSGNGASSLKVGTTITTTTTQTTTSTTCRWALKPCGQCLATPVEYCPRDPATEKAMLGPVSGMSLDTPVLDTSGLERRLSKKGCVAAASLYPEIGVCDDLDLECAHPTHPVEVETGKNISIELKITNHCINKADEDKEALLDNKAVTELLNATIMFEIKKYIRADYAELESPRLVQTYFSQEQLQEQNGRLKLRSGETDKTLVRYVATVRLKETNDAVEISARLRDRSIQIMEETNEAESNDCAQEEGTAWGSTAITVRATTSTTTTSATTTSATTTSTTTLTETTSTSSTSTRTTSTTTTFTTTTRPCACFEMCCEPEPVQGVHLPVVENVCPEWWQGKMTGRALVNTSGLDSSDLDKSLQMKGPSSAAERPADPPSERVVFRKWSGEEDIFRKWSHAKVGSESASRSSWVAIGASVVGSAAVLQAVLTLRRRSGVSTQVEMSTGDAAVMERLVQREFTNDW